VIFVGGEALFEVRETFLFAIFSVQLFIHFACPEEEFSLYQILFQQGVQALPTLFVPSTLK
jgi:hypothetical protein